MAYIDVTTYYLEMNKRPDYGPLKLPINASIIEWEKPDNDEYIHLYKSVGDDWGWTGRTQLGAEALQHVLHDENTKIYLLEINSTIAGFVELYLEADKIEIKYFGLLKDFIGKGYGGFLLKWGIQKAWDFNPKTVWVHTCEYDAEHALDVYKKMGFVLTDTQLVKEFYEDAFLEAHNKSC